ncbi:hypothetical protein CGCSCA5_v006335 [Colletotrichum siamense]|nr:hypothetical protein CGCSCA5_v006335 [Colletotrichum siamense]KAF4878040.1 hypothetical protein CGCSCA1_v002928 [Colletotrichum siamense]
MTGVQDKSKETKNSTIICTQWSQKMGLAIGMRFGRGSTGIMMDGICTYTGETWTGRQSATSGWVGEIGYRRRHEVGHWQCGEGRTTVVELSCRGHRSCSHEGLGQGQRANSVLSTIVMSTGKRTEKSSIHF